MLTIGGIVCISLLSFASANSETESRCDGHRQSPVPVKARNTKYSKYLTPLQFYKDDGYRENATVIITNPKSASGVFLTFPRCEQYVSLSGEKDNKYCIHDIRVLWGRKNYTGSEHKLEGAYHAAEIQVRAFNSEGYGSILEAEVGIGGLVIVSLIGELAAEGNEDEMLVFAKMNNFHNQLTAKGVRQVAQFPVGELFDDLANYYRYLGSDLFGRCAENTIVTVMQQPTRVTLSQLQVLRDFLRKTKRHPLRRLNEEELEIPRTVYRSFKEIIE